MSVLTARAPARGSLRSQPDTGLRRLRPFERDVNDFDETLPGPREWDVKRLAASLKSLAGTTGSSAKTNHRRTDM